MKTLRLFYLLPILALFMAVTVGCNDDDDDPEPMQMETTGTVVASFTVRAGAVTIAVADWDIQANLRENDGTLFLDRAINSNSLTFNNITPGSYYIDVAGDVTDTDGFTYTGLSGVSENFVVVAGETNSIQLDIN
ncbi:MAG TPA: hypothetical protein VJ917_00130 [Saprospiraceae bacterium]|nr:hypothetical protein [Saprospiraceae bacterium]